MSKKAPKQATEPVPAPETEVVARYLRVIDMIEREDPVVLPADFDADVAQEDIAGFAEVLRLIVRNQQRDEVYQYVDDAEHQHLQWAVDRLTTQIQTAAQHLYAHVRRLGREKDRLRARAGLLTADERAFWLDHADITTGGAR